METNDDIQRMRCIYSTEQSRMFVDFARNADHLQILVSGAITHVEHKSIVFAAWVGETAKLAAAELKLPLPVVMDGLVTSVFHLPANAGGNQAEEN